MKKYVVLENLSNGMKKGDEFIATRLSPFILTKLLAKGRVKEVKVKPEPPEKEAAPETADPLPKKNRSTKSTKKSTEKQT